MSSTEITTRPSIKDRIKHRMPEIIIGATAILGVVTVYYAFRKTNIPLPVAPDDTVEIVSADGVDSFFMMTRDVMDRLMKTGETLVYDTPDHGSFALKHFPEGI